MLIGGTVENCVIELELIRDGNELWCPCGFIDRFVVDFLEIRLIHLRCAVFLLL